MMTAAERMLDERFSRGVVERRARHLEQRKVLAPAIEQDLVAETVNHLEAENAGIETLGAGEVRHLNTKMIQPLESHRIRLSTSVDN